MVHTNPMWIDNRCFQALVEAKINDRFASIRSATHGIAFFATPHGGGNYASFGRIISNIVNTSLNNEPNKLVKSLEKESEFLVDLDQAFRHQLEEYFYVSFFENRHYHAPLKLVSNSRQKRLNPRLT